MNRGERSGGGDSIGDGPSFGYSGSGISVDGGMGTQAEWPEADHVGSTQVERPGSPSTELILYQSHSYLHSLRVGLGSRGDVHYAREARLSRMQACSLTLSEANCEAWSWLSAHTDHPSD